MSGVQTATFSRFDSCVDETLTIRALECGWIHSLQESWSRRLGRRVFGPGALKSWVDNLVSGLPFQPGINVFRGFGLENKMGCDLFEELLERHFVASVRKSRVPLGCQVLTLMRFPITIHLGLTSFMLPPWLPPWPPQTGHCQASRQSGKVRPGV